MTFEEVVGQTHVSRALANAISLKKIHHAYLFTGTRGVGKTTFARILSRALNCENGPTATPCRECSACKEVESQAGLDVQEIDAATFTGVENIRQLRDNAAYAPSNLKYKIYIIDEVHMLSKGAFNALLKILEEPPDRVIFVFATTEPHKIPETILSRVQRFDFRMLSDEEIAGQLRKIAATEKIEADDDALRLLARYAFGSMRDGLSFLEQAAVSGNGTVTAAIIEEMLGLVGAGAAFSLVEEAVSGSAGAALSRLEELLARGADAKYLYHSVVDALRDLAVLAVSGDAKLLFRHDPSSVEKFKVLGATRSRGEWLFLLDIAFKSESDILRTDYSARLGFELLLMRLSCAPDLVALDGLSTAASAGQAVAPRPAAAPSYRPPPSAAPSRPSTSPARPAVTSAAAPTPSAAPKAAQAPPTHQPSNDPFWASFKGAVMAKGKVLLTSLINDMDGRLDGNTLFISSPFPVLLERLLSEHGPVLQATADELAGRRITLASASEGGDKKKSEQVVAAENRETKDALYKKALSDPLVIEVLAAFGDANVVSVKPPPAKAEPVAVEPPSEEEP